MCALEGCVTMRFSIVEFSMLRDWLGLLDCLLE